MTSNSQSIDAILHMFRTNFATAVELKEPGTALEVKNQAKQALYEAVRDEIRKCRKYNLELEPTTKYPRYISEAQVLTNLATLFGITKEGDTNAN